MHLICWLQRYPLCGEAERPYATAVGECFPLEERKRFPLMLPTDELDPVVTNIDAESTFNVTYRTRRHAIYVDFTPQRPS